MVCNAVYQVGNSQTPQPVFHEVFPKRPSIESRVVVNAVGSDYRKRAFICGMEGTRKEVLCYPHGGEPSTANRTRGPTLGNYPIYSIITILKFSPSIRPKHPRFPFATLKPPEALYNEGITLYIGYVRYQKV